MMATHRRRLLREHARTFSLTLGILPAWLRDPLGLAYLLARASDTVADAAGISQVRRLVLLEELRVALDAGDPSSWRPIFLTGELSASEEDLMTALPELLDDLASHPDRAELLALWQKIVEGQLFDQRRFPSGDPLTRGELEYYCGLVAGSVGETWTRLIGKHAPQLLRGELGEMCRLGADYGRGLQLVNILRDRTSDRALGRVYASDAELPSLWDLATEWLLQGEIYLKQLSPGRVLYASGLPLSLAMGTLGKLRNSPRGLDAPRVSLTRLKVYARLALDARSLCFPKRG
jgi:farnesyl-diphosphate farnesyltransferase